MHNIILTTDTAPPVAGGGHNDWTQVVCTGSVSTIEHCVRYLHLMEGIVGGLCGHNQRAHSV